MTRDIKAKYYIENVEDGDFDDSPDLPDSIPLIKNFIGRVDYLVGLREFYKNGNRSFVLYGTGGVGKTATTLKFGEEIAGEYKARIFVDMQGTGENPLSATDAMYNVVRQFEPQIPANIPPSQLKGLFVSYVQRQPTLLVLDNAESEAQVAPLINVKDACVLVSSRNNFELTSGETVRLRAMSTEDAENLLFSIASKEKFEGKAGELAELAGCLPMALKPLAKLLKKEFWTIARILKEYADRKKLLEIKDAEHDNLSVEASFALSYDALTDELKKYWRSLAVFPADFESQAASTIFGLEFEDGWNVLELLYDYSLIEKDAKSTAEQLRFSLHDLARVFADAKLSEDEHFEAELRYAFYYSSILIRTDEMQSNNEENYYINALKLHDTEWSNITAGQKWTADFTEKDSGIAELCCYYSVSTFLKLRLHPREYISWQEASLTAARKINNEIYEGNFLQNLGIAYSNLGEYRKAIDYYEQALQIARKLNHRQGESQCLGNLGIAYYSLGEDQKAIEYHEQDLELSREIGDRYGEGCSLGNLGLAYQSLGEYQKAIEYHEKSLLIDQEIGNRLGEGQNLSNLGSVYSNLGEYRKAIEYHKQCLAISRELGNKNGEGDSLGNLGNNYYRLGEKKKACGLWSEAVPILEAIESPNANVFRQRLKEFCES